ncbi:MAG: hypothetical protein QXJ31_05130 [Candidatus Bathyarchaeia archaeon]
MSDWERKLDEWITNLRIFVEYLDRLQRIVCFARAHFNMLKQKGLLSLDEMQCLELDELLPLGPDPEICRNCIHKDMCPDYISHDINQKQEVKK